LTFEKVNEILAREDIPEDFKKIAKKVVREEKLSKREIVYLLKIADPIEKSELFELADALRKDKVGEMVLVKGIIEFSNYCKKNCTYCGIRVSNKVRRYRMKPDEIVKRAREVSEFGVDTIILQSGEDPFYTTETIVDIVRKIKNATKKPISLSIGERSVEEFKLFKEAGASKYLLKQESVNPRVFKNVHGEDYERRISLLKSLVSLGYVTGGGNIIGLPGQTLEDIADDIIFMRDIGVQMAGIGPFIPTKGTPLEKYPRGSADITLKTYACTRLAIPTILMPSTTALGTIDPMLQYEGLEVGCNVIMVNFTPQKYKRNYVIYDNKRDVEFYQTVRELLERNKKLSPLVLKAAMEGHKKGGTT